MQICHSIRASKAYSKPYIEHILEEFTPKWIEKYNSIFPDRTIKAIEFAKQDMRGAPSITLFDDRHCVPHQRHFSSYAEMLTFMQGFLAASFDYI
ncbi:MAG: hypothetical protein ABJF04_16175 [Reichenbachiella sp.]|uniref:hypothetical protein n=1 Tax=Reichenbachiella sp. TaxID=2184521 RepID=UPI003267F8A2